MTTTTAKSPAGKVARSTNVARSTSVDAAVTAAGIVLGARIPIILTSRAENLRTRLASAAVAVLIAHARRQAVSKAIAAE